MPTQPPDTLLHAGRFLRLVRRGGWEVATRANAAGVVAVVAQHDDGRVVLVEQVRPAVGAAVVELPAGLVGDDAAAGDESFLDAARRELYEETGYTARDWAPLGAAHSSPGLTDERITFFHATGLTRTGPGGGVDGEAITLYELAPADLPALLADWQREGRAVDMKLLAGLYAAANLRNE